MKKGFLSIALVLLVLLMLSSCGNAMKMDAREKRIEARSEGLERIVKLYDREGDMVESYAIKCNIETGLTSKILFTYKEDGEIKTLNFYQLGEYMVVIEEE